MPRISVIMANFRGAAFLRAALHSVLNQTLPPVEVIVSDDASPDDSCAVVRDIAKRDPRVRLIEASQNGGPGVARNRALEAATGDWLAVVDSDDLLHPERFQRLMEAALNSDVDAVADDLLYFPVSDGRGASLLAGSHPPAPLTAEYFIRSATAGSGLTSLGYLKPIFRREVLADLRYDPAVRIGEDYDLLLRFILKGGRVLVRPLPFYLYRRHSGSISHRLSEARVAEMIANQDALALSGGLRPGVAAALTARRAGLMRDLRFEQLVAALKARSAGRAAGLLLRDPGLFPKLARAAREHFSRRTATRSAAAELQDLILAGRGAEDLAPVLREALHPDGSALQITVAVPPEPGREVKVQTIAAAGQVVSLGLAGLYAAGFVPEPARLTAVIDREEELAQGLALARAMAARIVLPDLLLAQAAAMTDTRRAEPLCPGYTILDAQREG